MYPSKLTKNTNIQYSPILHVCINAGRGKAKFKYFLFLLDRGCISMIVMIVLIKKLQLKQILWYNGTRKRGNITTNMKVEIDLTSPEFSATKIMTWDCNVDEYAKGRYDMILGRDIWIELVLNLKFS